MKLWLDDTRDPTKLGFTDFVWVKTVEEAIYILETQKVNFASLDHDLGFMTKSGYDVILHMENNNIWPPEGVHVHSMNPVGRAKMEAAIKKHYGRNFDPKFD